MTRTKNFLRQNFFKVFLKTTFIHDLCHADHYEPKIFFRFLKSGPEGFPIMSVNVRYWHKRTWADKHDETFLQMIKDSRIPLCFAIPEDRPALCKTSPSESANVRPSPPLSVQVRQCPSKSANVRPSPPMSVYVRQCPKNHVRCLIESKKDRT